MKKIFPAMILLSATLLLGGCTRYEDMIPKELGAPEGLWLYRGAERMRTDGSDAEPLFDEIVLDGKTYTAEDYTVREYLYCTDEKTAFFVLSVDDGSSYVRDAYYVYDYAEKVGTQVGKMEKWGGIKATDSHVFFIEGYGNGMVVCARDGTFVAEVDEVYNNVEKNIAWKYQSQDAGMELAWWKDGTSHIVEVGYREGGSLCFYNGEYLYDCSEWGVKAIHSETEEMTAIPLGEMPYDYCLLDSRLYVMTCKSSVFDAEAWRHIHTGDKMYRVTLTEIELIYTFEEDWSMGIDFNNDVKNGYIKLWRDVKKRGDYERTYYYLNMESGKLKRGEAPTVGKSEKLSIGDYTFWIEEKRYGLFGLGECYYLYRSDGKKREIMQYVMGHDKFLGYMVGKFYDDICAF